MLTSVTQSCQQIQTLIDDFRVLDASKNIAGVGNMDERMDMGGAFGGGRMASMMGSMGGMRQMQARGVKRQR